MKFRLEFDCDGAAFTDDNSGWEVAAVLKEAANRVMAGHDTHVIHDTNGNRIGQWSLAEPSARWTLNTDERLIQRDGQNVARLGRVILPRPMTDGELSPAEMDALAHQIVAALNATDTKG